MDTDKRYLMENQREGERLETKTDEAETLAQLALVGLRPGMKALDAGAGTGAVARTIKKVVGPSGSVTALDGSADRLALGAELALKVGVGVEFVLGDLLDPPLEEASFDFVWSRFVFEYLADPDPVMARLTALAKPGGKVVVGDLDGGGLFHHPFPEDLLAQAEKLRAALAGRLDFLAGRKLYTRFRKAGLQDIRVHMLPYHFYPGGMPEALASNWHTKLDTIEPVGVKALGSKGEYETFRRRFLEMLRDPEGFTYSVLFLVEGLRPGKVA